jgi:hypothetical protein
MSDISANIVVQPNNLNITPTTNQLNITPEAIQLNIVAGGGSGAGTSNNGELLYNNVNIIGGVANTSFSNGNLSLGNVANVKIAGGTNGFVLQTDGAGNLTWAVDTGNITGNGVPGGSVNQIQYNLDGANFGGSTGFTFDPSSNIVSMPGNLVVANVITTNTINSNNYLGNGAQLSNITGANVSGNVASATVAGTVTTNAQPNITSVGTLTTLSTGNLSVSGTTSIFEALENVAIIGAQTGTYNFDLLDGSIQYSTANATANITINFRGNSTTLANTVIGNAKSITSTYLMTTGATPYTITAAAVDSSLALPVKWVGGVTPIPVANSVTAYTYTIVKTSTTPTYTIFGSATRYA